MEVLTAMKWDRDSFEIQIRTYTIQWHGTEEKSTIGSDF